MHNVNVTKKFINTSRQWQNPFFHKICFLIIFVITACESGVRTIKVQSPATDSGRNGSEPQEIEVLIQQEDPVRKDYFFIKFFAPPTVKYVGFCRDSLPNCNFNIASSTFFQDMEKTSKVYISRDSLEIKTKINITVIASFSNTEVAISQVSLIKNPRSPDSGNGSQIIQQGDQQDTLVEGSPIDAGLTLIDFSSLKSHLEFLASAELKGRGTGDEGNAKAAQWISEQFTAYGLKPGMGSSYLQSFSVSSGSSANVIGVLEGSDSQLKEEVIVVGAHFDHLGTENEEIYFGADDNASGSVAVLEIAKAAMKVRDRIKRTVVFALWTGEEMGLLGSSHYCEEPIFPLNKTVYVINLDMIGYLRQKGGDLSAIGGSSSRSAETFIQGIDQKYPNLTISVSESAGGGSDHQPFMEKGISAVFFHTGTHENYHQPTDTPDKIDYEGLQSVVKVAYELLIDEANDPTRSYDIKAPRKPFYFSPESRLMDHGGKRYRQ